MSKSIGIDLGTTNSVVAVLEAGDPLVIANQEGTRTTPSVVAFDQSGGLLVGEVAKRQSVSNPNRTVKSVKREMGTSWKKTIETQNGDKKSYTPEEISARILTKLKDAASDYTGTEVSSAVITVPAYFDDAQRTATKDAGKIAGLDVLRIINEPTAAALAYGMNTGAEETILVFDLGGGTFDVSVLEIADEVFEVKSTSGDSALGGDDWDSKIVDWLVKKFKDDNGIDLSTDVLAVQRLQEAAEKAKIELSHKTEASINLPFITANESGPVHMDYSLSRAKFEALTEDLLNRCRAPFNRAINDSGLSVKDIDHVILVGGSTRMASVENLVKELTGKDPHKGVNPDEVVAAGAAIQAGVLQGDVKDVLLLDVTPLSLGIETKGGIMTKLIDRNTTIPTQSSEIFTTAAMNQPSVEIHVLQGEREMSRYNKTLGTFALVDIPPAPAGFPQIEVKFDIDANGIVNVTATDKATGNEQSITITGQSSLDDNEINQMIKDAEEHAEDDRRMREIADAVNEADAVCFRADNLLSEHKEKLDASIVSDIEAKTENLRNLLSDKSEEKDLDSLKSSTSELMDAMQEAGKSLYDNTQSNQSEYQPDSAFSEDGDIVDAEIVED